MPTMQEFFDREHERLFKIETSLTKSRAELDEARTESIGTLKARRDEAAAEREARHTKMTDSVGQMQARVEAKKQETAATIEGWKQKREVNKLENRALDAEAYAEASLGVLELAQEEARYATLEALEARREAEEARQQSGVTA